uniref:Uncharacterized protein n=1 Tax=Anguilla anguilla TaxID=7936 RepID=A0A0E9TX12_ANGAN
MQPQVIKYKIFIFK